jgi:hypothetical protein
MRHTVGIERSLLARHGDALSDEGSTVSRAAAPFETIDPSAVGRPAPAD